MRPNTPYGRQTFVASLHDSLAFYGPSSRTGSALALARQRDGVHLAGVSVRWLPLVLKILGEACLNPRFVGLI